MKQVIKLTIVGVALLLLATVSVAFASSGGGPGGPGGGPGGPDGVNGKVTAIGTNSLTVLTANSKSVTVTTSTSTTVQILATGATASLSDIEVGDQVEVHGPRKQNGAIIAMDIIILPDGDQVSGRVTAVDDETITVRGPGEAPGTVVTSTIVTTSNTTFRKGQDAASLSDVEVGLDVRAYGMLASDGSLTASLVLIQAAPNGEPGEPGGEPGGQGGGPGGPGGGPGGPGGSGGWH